MAFLRPPDLRDQLRQIDFDQYEHWRRLDEDDDDITIIIDDGPEPTE